jgi:hypothetical protein
MIGASGSPERAESLGVAVMTVYRSVMRSVLMMATSNPNTITLSRRATTGRLG